MVSTTADKTMHNAVPSAAKGLPFIVCLLTDKRSKARGSFVHHGEAR